MGFLANSVAVWVTFLLALIFIVLTIIFFINENFPEFLRYAGGGFLLCLAVVSGIFWFWGATHRVVPPNSRWLIINTATGQIDGELRQPGVINKPFWMYQIIKYPGATEQPFCIDYFPAIMEGYEIKAHICGVYDASQLDWVTQYSQHNFRDETTMLTFWATQTKELVSTALKDVNYTKITTDRIGVSSAIRTSLFPWFGENGIAASLLQLENWEFTSVQVKQLVDQSTSASMKKTVEQQLLDAAQIARVRQLYEIETANLVLTERGKGLEALFASLGIVDDSAKAYLASQMTWYTYAQTPPSGVQIILGIGGNPIAVPIQQPTPSVVPVPTKTP